MHSVRDRQTDRQIVGIMMPIADRTAYSAIGEKHRQSFPSPECKAMVTSISKWTSGLWSQDIFVGCFKMRFRYKLINFRKIILIFPKISGKLIKNFPAVHSTDLNI